MGRSRAAHNDEMIRRQDVLESAWTTYLDANKNLDDASFDKGWQDARVRALQKMAWMCHFAPGNKAVLIAMTERAISGLAFQLFYANKFNILVGWKFLI